MPPPPDATILNYLNDREGGAIIPSPDATTLHDLNDREMGGGGAPISCKKYIRIVLLILWGGGERGRQNLKYDDIFIVFFDF